MARNAARQLLDNVQRQCRDGFSAAKLRNFSFALSIVVQSLVG